MAKMYKIISYSQGWAELMEAKRRERRRWVRRRIALGVGLLVLFAFGAWLAGR
jgi:hypothetical protein